MLSEAQFPFLAEKGHVVSLVGGGGKTTLLYQLSAHCARKGWRVLAATTTHIRQPDHNMAHTEAECSALWAAGEYAVLGTPDGCGKLTAPPPDLLHRWKPTARNGCPARLRHRGNRCCCRNVTPCWPWPGFQLWAALCGRSASGWTKPVHCCTPHRTSP